MKSKKLVFIADFFREDLLGGAESNDSVLIRHFEKIGYEVKKIPSHTVSNVFIENNSAPVIVGNFINLSEQCKESLRRKGNYIIYEHDHKYLKSRDPSVYLDFKAPESDLVNVEFYRDASTVVVLSKICKEILEKNLGIDNVRSIGTSLWSEEKFNQIYDIHEAGIKRDIEYGVLGSTNPVKGSRQAIDWCTSNGKSYQVLGSKDEVEFLKQLSRCERLVFMPQVLETFNRLTVEAKMLGCKLVTKPNMLGFASEECFKLSGYDLIGEMRMRVGDALDLFRDLVYEIERQNKEEKTDITAILTCYKRPHLLGEQIEALRNQTIPPKEIWVWINEPEQHDFDYSKIKLGLYAPDVKIFDCNHNWKYYGRFAAAMMATTEYVAFYDDDTMPGKMWHQNCLETMKTSPGLLGGVGCVLQGEQYRGHQRIGWSAPNKRTERVDLVGHAWFLKTEWLKHFWQEKPYTWDNGEDIHLSYMLQKYGNIKTYVPPHDEKERFSSLKGMEYGVDDVASSATRNHEVFYKQRDEAVQHAVKRGWKLVRR